MTKKQLRNRFIVGGAIYLFAVLVGVSIRYFDGTTDTVIYGTYKDMIPFLIAIPAAWLGYSLQRRASYLAQLRSLWSSLVNAVQIALEYTYLADPKNESYRQVLHCLSCTIDEVRGVFMNLGESEKERGLYPFEPIKDIYYIIRNLDCNNKTSEQERENVRKKINALWGEVRKELLKEFDREIPTFSHSHWDDTKKGKVYKKHDIEKTPT
jgi:hypothetical protein